MAPELRREQLLDAALAIIARDGYGAVSMEAIARETGVTKPVAYRLFAGLGPLLTALLDREEERALEQLAAVLGPPSADARPETLLDRGVSAFLRAVAERPDAWRLILTPGEAMPDAVRERVQRQRAEVAERLEPLVSWGLAELGEPSHELDTEVAAHALMGAVEAAARLVLDDPERFPPDRFARAVRRATSRPARGV